MAQFPPKFMIIRTIFYFDTFNFSFLDGDVPRRTSYGVCIPQIIRFARASSNLSDFNCRYKINVKTIAFGNKEHTTEKKMGISVLLRLFISSNEVCNTVYVL